MPVGLVIVSHSTQLAAGVAELAGQMAQGKTPIAAAGGAGEDGENILGTSVDRILVAIQSVAGPEGVLVLLDLGSAILSAEMALEFLDEEQREHVQFTIAPLVEGAVAAALEASLGRSLAQVKQAAERTATREQLQLLKPLSQEDQPETEAAEAPAALSSIESAAPVLEATLSIMNPTGLHARPASLFVQAAAQYDADIQVANHGKSANATNIIGVLSLGARQGDAITIRAQGPQAEAALTALSELIRANFYETEPLPATNLPVPEISQSAAATQEMASAGETMGGVDGAAMAEATEAVRGAEAWKGIRNVARCCAWPGLCCDRQPSFLENHRAPCYHLGAGGCRAKATARSADQRGGGTPRAGEPSAKQHRPGAGGNF